MTDEPTPPADAVARAVVQKLQSLQRAGVTHLGKIPKLEATEPSGPSTSTPEEKPQPSGAVLRASIAETLEAQMPADQPSATRGPAPTPPPSGDERSAALAAVAREVAACTRCDELVRNRTQTVFGVGDPHARLAFLGEAPGADEDRQGEPFVGRAGKLLTDMVEKGMKLKRSDVYILNILRCRPPGNRNPTPMEAAHCREFLDRQLEIIQPEFICCLGAVAAQNLLDTVKPIGKLRGQFHDYQGIKVLCTYHPAYLLRNPSAKRPTWEDLQLLMAEMGIGGG